MKIKRNEKVKTRQPWHVCMLLYPMPGILNLINESGEKKLKVLEGRNEIRISWKVCSCGKQENEINLEGNTIPLLLAVPAKLVSIFPVIL